MKSKTVIYKRTLFGFGPLVRIAEFSSVKYELVISTDGVLTMREFNNRSSIFALARGEWHKAVEV